MKKLIIILCLFIFCCQTVNHQQNRIREKGIDNIDINLLPDVFKISSVDKKGVNTIELYWIKIYGNKEKIYISLFCYEDFEVGDNIDFEYCKDVRFDAGEEN